MVCDLCFFERCLRRKVGEWHSCSLSGFCAARVGRLERPPALFSLLTHDSFRVLRFRLLQASSDGGLSATALHLKRHGVGDVGIGEDVELLAAIGLRCKSQIDAPDGACLE